MLTGRITVANVAAFGPMVCGESDGTSVNDANTSHQTFARSAFQLLSNCRSFESANAPGAGGIDAPTMKTLRF